MQTSIAQVTKKLGDFNTVKVFDKLNVKLISGSENKVIITGVRNKK
jgi:phosphopantetheine adenylyltransferase